MPRFIADLFFAADRPFELAAKEINKLITPHMLRVTDRFDEVPGYVAEFNGVAVAMQGIPADLTAEEIGENPVYYLNVRLEANDSAELPSWLGVEQLKQPIIRNGYVDLSAFLRRRVKEITNLRCVDDRSQVAHPKRLIYNDSSRATFE